MAKFIKVHDQDGSLVALNAERIIRVKPVVEARAVVVIVELDGEVPSYRLRGGDADRVMAFVNANVDNDTDWFGGWEKENEQ